MRQFLAILAASSAAALAPALACTCLFYVLDHDRPNPIWPLVLLVATIVAFAHTLLFGLVAAGWLLRIGKFRLLPMLLAGLVIGAVPAAIWQHPWGQTGTLSSSWANGVQIVDNGVLTLAGWINYFQFVGYAAVFGGIGAIAFYFTYRNMSPNGSSKPDPLGGAA